MDPFHHIQHQGQHNLHTGHASFYLHLPKKKEKKYFTYKMGTILTIWEAITYYVSLPMISNGTYSLKWDCGASIFHSPKASATNTNTGFHL
jgi:hypothetical protein